jgi:hypothetical protein
LPGRPKRGASRNGATTDPVSFHFCDQARHPQLRVLAVWLVGTRPALCGNSAAVSRSTPSLGECSISAPGLYDGSGVRTGRWADDAEGAADLAVLLGILITAAERRLSNKRQQ